MQGRIFNREARLTDGDGNYYESHLTTDGGYHMGTSISQSVYADDNNSSTTNLTSANSYTFTGTATSTLGVVGLQWGLKTDQNATVYVEESNDGTNWDISYQFDYIAAKGGRGETVQASLAYWRLRVVLTGTTDTTYFRLSGVLCPVAVPLPSELSPEGRLKTESGAIDVETGIKGRITPFGRSKVTSPVRMIGTAFSGTTKDPNFWTETVTGTGSIAQAGKITLATGTTADSTAKYETARRARHVGGTSNELKFTGRLIDAPVADNIRRMGVYDSNDGFFFQVDGTTFGVGARKGGVDTVVESGSFNGNYGNSLTIGTSIGNFVIWYWERVAYFFVNGKLLHTLQVTTTSLVNTNSFPITIENINENGNDADISLEVYVASVTRFGELVTNATYYHISGNAATHVMKYGAGVLQKIIFNNTSGTSITIYDNTAGSGTVIGIITTASAALGEWTYNVPFSNGLTMVTVGNSLDATVIYE